MFNIVYKNKENGAKDVVGDPESSELRRVGGVGGGGESTCPHLLRSGYHGWYIDHLVKRKGKLSMRQSPLGR